MRHLYENAAHVDLIARELPGAGYVSIPYLRGRRRFYNACRSRSPWLRHVGRHSFSAISTTATHNITRVVRTIPPTPSLEDIFGLSQRGVRLRTIGPTSTPGAHPPERRS